MPEIVAYMTAYGETSFMVLAWLAILVKELAASHAPLSERGFGHSPDIPSDFFPIEKCK